MDDRAATFQRRAAEAYDIDVDIHEFPDGTETAAEAATAIGCDRAQIANSLAFVADTLVVVVTSGANEVDARTLATRRGVHDARLAEPEEVQETLGWPIGGVPPFCHETDVPVYVDETLTEYVTVWAGAGSPDTMFPIPPEDIVTYAGAEVIAIAM